jgi:F-type H+-transporting ATPase subunit b
MIIDWYTVIFQIVNFLILVFLLRYFLYGPIIRAMDERERKIVEREEQAESSIKAAEAEAESFRNRSEELRKSEEQTMEKARAAADEEKAKLFNMARQEVDQARKRWEDAFELEKESFTVELRRRIGHQACTVARRCLADLADSDLEELIRNRFIQRIKELPEAEQHKLASALKKDQYEATVIAAFDFPAAALKDLTATLKKLAEVNESKLALTSKKEPDLICGVELTAGGHRVAWSVDHYLADVEEQILMGLEQKGNTAEKEEGAASDKS